MALTFLISRVIEKDGPEERGEERFYYKEVENFHM